MATEFSSPTTTPVWDGLQAMRLIRDWEDAMTATSKTGEIFHIPMVALSKLHVLVNDMHEALTAGADLFLLQPFVDFLADTELMDRVQEPTLGTSTTTEIATKRSERRDYNDLAQSILHFLYKSSTDVNITTTISAELSALLTPEVKLSLPGPTTGQSIRLQGTIGQLNEAMRHLFYYATNNTYGDAVISISLEDDMAHCVLPTLTYDTDQIDQQTVLIANTKSSTNYFVQPAVYPILPVTGFNASHVGSGRANFTAYLCDSVSMQRHKYISTAIIPLFVVAVNSPAVIMVMDEAVVENGQFIAVLNQQQSLPLLVISDADHNENVANLKTSYGVPITPPISVLISANGGRFSFPVTDGVYLFNLGGTYFVSSAVLQGSIPDVNNVLAAALYTCLNKDGCVDGYQDSITLTVDDLGFHGKGGPQVTTVTVRVLVRG